jgi:cytochrome P450
MRYLDRVYLEVERLHPPFTGAFRRAVREFEFEGFRVPAGCKVFYAITGTHHSPDLYPEPDRFDPDRFEGANVAELRRDCRLVGFGAGARTCLGIEFARLEAKVVASHLLRGHRWRLAAGQNLAIRYLPSLHPADGLRVAFEPHPGTRTSSSRRSA